ncbi:glycoside hydrolase family 105 protein [Paenibacillus allorhizosphaerae]|uniref:Unsaturated rhamnogalacturonyl hydrolase YesR n=1 Tax=Paenibacillus allorhizosphaerae TaxID=2849866 RepID=A0ABN7TDJ8_9BACL|nr:glycoside hydrolase family 88 protein [Paenibacillus allorhizosphaerae]CAG7625216.1 Unsaturated rhamnogalacturonyl hydrolase YesR [Paenibacillus allorhizosphaerae]
MISNHQNITSAQVAQAKAVLRKVYAYMTSSDSDAWGMDIDRWDWTPGVGLISILHSYEATQEAGTLHYLERWVERNQEKAALAKVINSMAPYAVFPELYRSTQRRFFLEEAVKIGDWMLHEAPRTREGAFEHTVTEKANFPEQVWADTIFMAVLFLARLAALTGRADYAKEALEQVAVHFRLLQDRDSGVMYHGWNCLQGDHMSAAKWTRANAWVVIGFPLIAKELQPMMPIPGELLDRYREMVDGLLGYRGENGLWHTVMDREDFYQETSGSAGIAAGIICSVRHGLLDRSYLDKAAPTFAEVLNRIDEEGQVLGVSGGTPIMKTIEDYNRIPVIPTLYGQGLALMLLAEMARLEV